MAASAARGATSPPPPPAGSGDPVVDANAAAEWSRGYFNSRAFGYWLQLGGQQIRLGTILGG